MELIFILICILNYSQKVKSTPVDLKEKRTPTLLISLDGLRASSLDQFMEENPHSFLKKKIVDVGVKADFMQPAFPTLTFPNHYTIVTGLYMENHGIVGNSYYDPEGDRIVRFLSDEDSLKPRWWNKTDPIWLTAKNQGLKTSSFFWPGSEVWTRNPDHFLSYTNAFLFKQRCEEVVSWLTKFEMDFVTLYFNEPDHTGHSYGADSQEYRDAIRDMDWIIGYLIELMEQEDIADKINILIVSDHGMADMKNETIFVYDHVDSKLINSSRSIFGIVSNIYPNNEQDKAVIFDALSKVANLRVFYKENIPKELHYQNSNRIAPIVAIADEGYVMSTRRQTLKGNHGFDSEIEAMRAIFLARGPDFKKSMKINSLNNVDVYPLLCQLLMINCNANNGTMAPFSNVLNLKNNSSLLYPSCFGYFIFTIIFFFF